MRAVGTRDRAAVLRSLCDANVQFVVVGESHDSAPLMIVVSTHPTNLGALARALDALESRVRTSTSADTGDRGARRVVDPLGTVAVTTSGGDVDILLGGSRCSLYAQVAGTATSREIEGELVSWIEHVSVPERVPRVTGDALGRRLAALAGNLAHLGVLGDRRVPPPDPDEADVAQLHEGDTPDTSGAPKVPKAPSAPNAASEH